MLSAAASTSRREDEAVERELLAVLLELSAALIAAFGIGRVLRRPAEARKQPEIFP